MNQPLAIVGASARAAAASALRAGFQSITADLFGDADLRQFSTTTRISPYPEGLLDWLRAIEPPAWMYTGALENHPELVDQMAWIAPLWGNPGEVLLRVRSPWELGHALRAAGLLFPETRASSGGLPLDGSWLAKTYRGASGSGVWEWSKEQGAGSREKEWTLPACFQRCIIGTPCGAVFVAADGQAALLGVTRQLVGGAWLGAHGFQYGGSIGPLSVSENVLATIARIGDVIASQFELVGLFGVDMILEGDDVWSLEVNPRYTASVEIVERATGSQAVAVHAAACQGLRISDFGLRSEKGVFQFAIRNPQSAIDDPAAHGKAILYAKRDIVVSQEFADMALAEAMMKPWPTLADVSPAGTAIDAGRPILTLFAHGATPEEVERRLHGRVAELERMIYPREIQET